ncbi:MAG: bifunctional DNA-formamidopyrimidine glycosylase/DNA-(apurinic or apyrimidinic site) lyase [Candidatus Sericytochromatia bacterium]|nr:bifunctional DNA-formamidopyrimidine glycosylase/DNA-(apurinic or apyrimidinic site) lyase [Candidatus Sericytochromatia bacterium]
MPELPEVETAARDLAAHVGGARIAALQHLDWPRLIAPLDPEGFGAAIKGQVIQRVSRRAKWLLLELSGGLTLAVHLRMSGSLFVPRPEERVDAHTRLVLALSDGRTLHFRDVRKFGRMRLLDAAGLAALDAAHGPEPLADAFTPACLKGILRGRTTRIKPLLLDQSLIAGIGNIYADEALWHSQLHPERPADSLRANEVQRLHEAIRFVLDKAIRLRGSTLRDYRTGTGESGENQDHFLVYGRTGAPCGRCHTALIRCVVAQRGTHLCPHCQTLPPARGSARTATPRAR